MTIKTTFAGIASLALLAGSVPIAASAMARDASVQQMEKQTVKGDIVSVSATNKRFVIQTRSTPESESQRVVVRVDEDTKYTLDGEESTLEEAVQPGRTASAQTEEGVATRVDVTAEDE